jgi:anti-anti-sigma regulatory factor
VAGIIGQLDIKRLERIRNDLVEYLRNIKPKSILLDISSALIADSEAARAFVKLVRTIRLMGPECFIVGIVPELAAEIEQHVTDISSFKTFTTLEMALEAALSSVGYKISELGK